MTTRTCKAAAGLDDHGLTLVEMMVGVLLFSMLSAGAFMVLSGQQRGDQAQQRSSTALDNARLTVNTIASQLRVGKAGMPDGVCLNRNDVAPTAPGPPPVQCPSASGIVPAIEVIDGGNTGSDRLRVIYPDGGTWGTLTAAVTPTSFLIRLRTPDDQPPALASTEWGMLTNFDRAVLFQPLSTGWPCSGVECTLKAISSSSSWFAGSLANIPAGRTLLRARWLEYAVQFVELNSGGIQVATGGELPALTATALTANNTFNETQPAALGIEDLQVALGVDINGNGVIDPEVPGLADADEWIHNVSGETLASAISPNPVCDLGQLLAVRINIVARTTSRDHGAKTNRPQLENRVAGSVDGYHRIVLTTVVGLRH